MFKHGGNLGIQNKGKQNNLCTHVYSLKIGNVTNGLYLILYTYIE